MIKKIVIVLLSACVGVGIFYGGFYTGVKFFAKITTKPEFSEHHIKLVETQIMLEQLQDDRREDLRSQLLISQDTEIIVVYSMLKHLSDDSKIKLEKILRRIAKVRAENEKFYNDKISNKYVTDILSNYIPQTNEG